MLMPKETSGGSAETEVREVAVKPTGPAPLWAVITATPAACRRKADRRRSDAAVMEVSFSGEEYGEEPDA